MNILKSAVAAVALSFAAVSAHASVVTFSGDPATNFEHGTFSHGVDKDGYGIGFYPLGGDGPRAYNSSGKGESIFFSEPVWLGSLGLSGMVETIVPDYVTVSVFDSANNFLASRSEDIPGWSPEILTLTFNVDGVSRVDFSLGWYADPRDHANFIVQDIIYSVDGPIGAVPEPATLALFGLAACAVVAAHRKRA